MFTNIMNIKESERQQLGKYFASKGKRDEIQGTYPYAIVVKKDGITVSHLPHKILRICSLFLIKGGKFSCT